MKQSDMDKLTGQIAKYVKGCTTVNDATRAELWRRYMGEPDGNEQDNQSKFMDTSVRDIVDTIHVQVMDVLSEGDALAEFVPVGPDDEEQAEQETDVVGHIIWQMNEGYNLIGAFTHEAMIEQMAYMSAGWEERDVVNIDQYMVASLDELQPVLQQYGEDYIITEAEQTDEGIRVVVRCEKQVTEYKIKHFPQAEMNVMAGWPSVSLVDCPFLGRVRRDWNRQEARAFGFADASIDKLTEEMDGLDEQARERTRFHSEETDKDSDGDELTIGEFYVKWAKGKGPATYWQVWTTRDGKTILDWEDGTPACKEVPDHPFVSGSPRPFYHRHAGGSIAELGTDIQAVKTVITRQMLDNVYTTQYARPIIGVGASQDTIADLQNPKQGWPIRMDDIESLRWDRPPSIVDTVMPILEQMTELQAQRTGSTKYSQGLDAASLNKTASGIRQIMSASQKRILAVARTFKELTIKQLYMKVHADLRRGPGKALTLRLRGKWVEVDPRAWRQRQDITVSSTSDKEVKQQGVQVAVMLQEKLLASGNPELMRMVTPDKLYASAERTLAAYGFKSAAPFFNDPAKLPPLQTPPEQPNPLMIQVETERMKMQADAADKQSRAQNDHMRLQIEAAKLKLEEARVTGVMENQAEANDIKRDIAAAEDDRARELEMAAIGVQQAQAIAAIQPNPVIDNG